MMTTYPILLCSIVPETFLENPHSKARILNINIFYKRQQYNTSSLQRTTAVVTYSVVLGVVVTRKNITFPCTSSLLLYPYCAVDSRGHLLT